MPTKLVLALIIIALFVVAVCGSGLYDASEACDACRTLTEQFQDGWEVEVRKQAGDGRADSTRSDVPPTITYNQEIEDYLQGFCYSERITKFRDYVRKGCKRVMDVHKREVVAKYLSVSEIVGSSMKATRVPLRTREVCSGLSQECKRLPTAYDSSNPGTKVTKCEACQRVIRDAEMVLRRSRKYTDKLKSIDVFEHLETLCPSVYRRYDDDPDTVFNMCELLFEEHEDPVLASLAKKDKDAATKICVDVAEVCSPSDISK